MFIPFGICAQEGFQEEIINQEALTPAFRYESLDKTEITTDNLINRALIYTNHALFYKDSSVGVNNYSGWLQLYHEIYNGYYNKSSRLTADTVNTMAKTYKTNNIIPILIMDLEYNQLKETAIIDSLIYEDNDIFKDVFPRNESPYEIKRVISFSPATDVIYKNDYTFLLSQQFFFTNQSSLPTSIEIDFDDGNGFVQLNWGNAYFVTYNDPNVAKTLSLRLIYDNDSTESQSILKSSSKCTECNQFLQNTASLPDEVGHITGNVPPSIPYVTGSATIDYYIKSNAPFKTSPEFLDKPFIIVEGLNFEDTDCPNVPFKNGTVGWCTLWGKGGEKAFDLAPNLLNSLLAQGYDIIMIDYRDGATYIERNAAALMAFLYYLNEERNAGPSVIVGTSMGGLVARYALARMELANIKHCNRLYISADSPQQGANIPNSVQEYLKFLSINGPGFINSGVKPNYNNIQEPAPKQMLINHVDAPFGLETIERQHFKTALNDLGYPKKTRNIALSNGSRTGATLGMLPGNKVFEWTIPSGITTLCTFSNDEVEIWAKPHNNLGRVFRGKIVKRASVNLCLGLGTILCNFCVNHYTAIYNGYFHGQPSHDIMPGGRRETYQDIADAIDEKTPVIGFTGTVFHNDHCFIPTKSGLDLNSSIGYFDDLTFPTNIIDQNDPNLSLVFSPFEKLWAADGSSVISGSSQNELHVELTPGNINWLIREACAGEPNLGSMLTTTYNFARPENRFLYDVNIASGGNLLVNAQQLSDFGVNTCVPAVLPIPGPTFVLETSDCMSALEIENGGNMQIGDNTAGNAAKVIIHSGVEVTLRTGSKLLIHNNSTLIIEKGAKLIYEPGAEIQLLGDEAVLEIQGELEVKDNATFTFTYPNANSGYLKFNVPFNPCQSNPNWACPVIIAGQNSKMELRGADKNDKILEIAGEDMLIPEDMAFFRLWLGKAEFTTPGARLSLASTNYQLVDATFVGTVNNRGVVVWGNSASIIARCEFDNVKLRGDLYAAGNRLNVINSNFTNGAYVETNGRGVFFSNVDFDNLNVNFSTQPFFAGWKSFLSDVPSVYTNGNIQAHIGALSVFSTIGAGITNDLSFSSTHLNKVSMLRAGVTQLGGELSMRCSNIIIPLLSSNLAYPRGGLFFSDNAQLRMSALDGNGFNTISGSQYSIDGFNVDLLDFEYGFNDFSIGSIVFSFAQSASIPLTIGGNTNTYFSTGPATLDPNVVSDPFTPGNQPKIRITDGFCGFNQICNFIPVQWQLFPNQPPTPPCTGGGGGIANPTGTISALKFCPTCPVVNSANFSNVSLNEAIEIASSFMEISDTMQNDISAVALFHEIFTTTPIDFNDYNQVFLVKYGYSNMKTALQHCFVTGRLNENSCVPVLDNSVEQFMEVINIRKAPVSAQNVAEQFFLELDEALVFRLIGQRDEAIIRLEAIDNCFLTQRHRQILKNTIATTKVERDVINGTVPLMAAIDLMDAIPRLEIKSNASVIDTTATIHPTAIIGSNVTIGSNVVIEQDVVIGSNTVIEDNVIIKKNSTLGENVLIKQGTIIEKEVEIGSHTAIGSYTIIKQNTTIGEHTTINDSIVIEKDVTIYNYVDIETNVLIKKETTIGNGVFIGKNAIISKEITIGELAIIRENAEINDKVKVGNKNIIAKAAKVKNNTETGKEVLVEENIHIPANKEICDNENVNSNFNFSNVCAANISPPVLVSNTNSCAFAMGYAQTRTNFINGFQLGSDVKLVTDEEVTFKPDNLSSFYNWEFGDCGTSTNEQASYTFRKPGIYLVKLIQGTTCDTVVYYGAVTVFPNPKSEISPIIPQCLADEDVKLNRATTIDLSQPSCIPTADCTPFIPLKEENCRLKLIWDFDNDSIKEETIALNDTNLINGNIAVQYDTNNVFIPSLITSIENREETYFKWEKACEKDTATAEITITNSFKVSMAATGCAPGEVQFTSTTFGGVSPFTYSWIFGNGLIASTSSPLITVADTGMLSVELTITDANNCVSHLLSAIYILDCNANARTSENNGEASTKATMDSPSILKIENSVKAYPNPTTGQIIFEYSLNDSNAQLVITDIMGKIVNTVKINGNNKTSVDLSKFPKGIYLYKVIGKTKIIASDKLILME